MNEWDVREALCEIGRRIWQKEYVASNDGNFTYRLDDDRVLATPTLVSKGFMKPDDLVVVGLKDGKQISGHMKMTSEVLVHLHIYRRRPDVRAVVHAHPPNATAFCVARQNLPKCVLPEVEIFLGQIPVAPYATPGTQDFAEAITPFLKDHWAFLLSNHGAITLGKDPFHAYYNMETLESYCRILILARQIGDWNQIDYQAMQDLFKIKERLGISDPRDRSSYAAACRPGVDPTEYPVVSDTPKLAGEATGDNGGYPAGSSDLADSAPPVDRTQIEGMVREALRRKGLL